MAKGLSDIIRVKGLAKSFDGTTAVDDISFSVESGMGGRA
jgi:ABC-type branched-subunit amino acid transport system ATPase component